CSTGIGNGTPIGVDRFEGVLRTDFTTLTGLVPGQPFTISEVFTFSQDRCCIPNLPQGDVGAAIFTTPTGCTHAGSCAHRWCWAAGPALGERWPSRLVATAATSKVSLH